MDRPAHFPKEANSIVFSTGFLYPGCSACRGTLLYRTEALTLLGGFVQRKAKIGASVFNSAQGEVVMKRDSTTNTGTVKASASPDLHTQQAAAAPWNKSEKRSDAPAPPPVWTRYVDSRLKQFCAR